VVFASKTELLMRLRSLLPPMSFHNVTASSTDLDASEVVLRNVVDALRALKSLDDLTHIFTATLILRVRDFIRGILFIRRDTKGFTKTGSR